MAAYEIAANLRHPCRIIGIGINTRTLTAEQAEAEILRAEATYGLPACDVYRNGADKLVQASIALRDHLLASKPAVHTNC